MFDLTGKKALVTGASGGIGEAIARTFHARGAIVGLHGTREEKLNELAGELGERTIVLPANLSDLDAVDEQHLELADAAIEQFGERALRELLIALEQDLPGLLAEPSTAGREPSQHHDERAEAVAEPGHQHHEQRQQAGQGDEHDRGVHHERVQRQSVDVRRQEVHPPRLS